MSTVEHMPSLTRESIAALDSELSQRLKQSGHRVTSQRLLVHRALCARDAHLTAEQVLEAVSDDLPSISLPTIYATLELLEELGLVRRVAAGSGPLLYDSRTTPHAHAVCRRCGSVRDVDRQTPNAVSRAASDASSSGAPDAVSSAVSSNASEPASSTASEPASSTASEPAAYAASDAAVIEAARIDGFQPDHAQLLIWGLCASCAGSGE